jgi:hypothetical protein
LHFRRNSSRGLGSDCRTALRPALDARPHRSYLRHPGRHRLVECRVAVPAREKILDIPPVIANPSNGCFAVGPLTEDAEDIAVDVRVDKNRRETCLGQQAAQRVSRKAERVRVGRVGSEIVVEGLFEWN